MEIIKKTSIGNGFDSVFQEFVHEHGLNLKNNNCLRLFYLDICNNSFSYLGLHRVLQQNIGRYVFSRASIDQFIEDGDAEAIGLKAVELLRTASSPADKGAGGELGEILLYLFLEQKLNAPKLLSKVELKTTGNQYVFGSDGVHLLQLNEKAFQLVLGEAKIKGKLKDAVDNAFESIMKVSQKPDNEIRLIEKSILAESFSEDTRKLIESIIIPTKRNQEISTDNAFGIFLGYTVDIDPSKYSNDEFRQALLNQLKIDICQIAGYITNKINALRLSGYSFYFYILPFNDASKDRAEIIKKLKGEQ